MKWNIIIIKILDVIHDLLCPVFRNDLQKTEDKEEKSDKK